MARIVGTRLGLVTYSAGTDPRPGREEHNTERDLIEANAVIGGQGTESARPTAGKSKALYFNESRGTLQWDTGTAWQDISTNGGGGPATTVAAGGANAEGTSARGARADHVHKLDFATATVGGAMSAADKAKLDNATSANTADRLVIRDAGGRAQVVSPSVAADIANKGYVDSIVGGAAAPVVTADNNGLATPTMLARTDKVGDAATGSTAGTLVLRDAAGRTQFANPSATNDAANKSYVDTQIQTHRHDASHVTGGIFSSARLPVVSSTQNGAMTSADKSKLDAANTDATANTLVQRTSGGTVRGSTPSLSSDLTTKGYVDSATSQLRTATWDQNANTLALRGSDGTFYVAGPTKGSHPTTKNYVDAMQWDGSRIVSGIVPHARIQGSTHGYNTTSSVNTVYSMGVDITGRFVRTSSTERDKGDIKDWTPEPRDLLDPKAAVYRRKLPDGTLHTETEVGVIAEQAGTKVPEFLQYGPDHTGDTQNRIQGWDYSRWTAAHQVLHRWHASRDDDQDARLARIEEALGLNPPAES